MFASPSTAESGPIGSRSRESGGKLGAFEGEKEGAGKTPATMKAAVLVAPGAFELREVPVPEPGPMQVRIKVEGCGVCASNIPSWEGRPWIDYPLLPGAPGHEGWGVVDAVGEGQPMGLVGRRVAYFSSSAFAEYDLAQHDALVLLPESLAELPFPGEPFGCAFNVFQRSGIRRGDWLAVIGIGFIGAVVTALAKAAGAKVIAIGRRPFSLELARSYGADHVVPMEDHHQIIEKVRILTDGALCDRVVEAVGEQWPLDLAGELCRERGRLIIAGYHQDPRQVNMQLWNWRGLDVVNAHERELARYREGSQAAVEAIAKGIFNPKPLLTHHLPLEQIADAFALLRSRPEGFMKVTVMP